MSLQPTGQKTVEELLAQINGEDMEEFRRSAVLRKQLNIEAERYYDVPANLWPTLQFNWDTTLASQRFALDGVKQNEFKTLYSDGLILGHVLLQEFDSHLCHFSRRDGPDELWELGFKSSLAYLIAYLAHGHPITPPLVAPNGNNEMVIRGGHHRYAAAKASGLFELPFYVQTKHKSEVDRIILVRWDTPQYSLT